MKNIDYIKSLDDEQFSEWFVKFQYCESCPLYVRCIPSDLECGDIIKQWLNEERKDEQIY